MSNSGIYSTIQSIIISPIDTIDSKEKLFYIRYEICVIKNNLISNTKSVSQLGNTISKEIDFKYKKYSNDIFETKNMWYLDYGFIETIRNRKGNNIAINENGDRFVCALLTDAYEYDNKYYYEYSYIVYELLNNYWHESVLHKGKSTLSVDTNVAMSTDGDIITLTDNKKVYVYRYNSTEFNYINRNTYSASGYHTTYFADQLNITEPGLGTFIAKETFRAEFFQTNGEKFLLDKNDINAVV